MSNIFRIKVKFQIKCPLCGLDVARISYEENRLYEMFCPACQNRILHFDSSWINAQRFFESIKRRK